MDTNTNVRTLLGYGNRTQGYELKLKPKPEPKPVTISGWTQEGNRRPSGVITKTCRSFYTIVGFKRAPRHLSAIESLLLIGDPCTSFFDLETYHGNHKIYDGEMVEISKHYCVVKGYMTNGRVLYENRASILKSISYNGDDTVPVLVKIFYNQPDLGSIKLDEERG